MTAFPDSAFFLTKQFEVGGLTETK